MNTSRGLRSTAVIALAICLFLGLIITPSTGDGAAALLQTFREHSPEAYLTGLFRFLTSLLIVPALLAITPSIQRRGSRLFRVAAVLLHVASFAGVVVFTQMVLHNAVLAPMPNRESALGVAEAIEASLLWQISTTLYLLGLLAGFLLLGISIWLAELGRLVATAISLGLIVHIAGGDWMATSLTGALILSGGLTALGVLLVRGSGRREGAQLTPDAMRHPVSDEPR